MELGSRREALMVRLREKPAAAGGTPVAAPLGRAPAAMVYKVMGKMFAIVGLGNVEHVILKCEPHLVELLKATYAGVGHQLPPSIGAPGSASSWMATSPPTRSPALSISPTTSFAQP